MIYNEELVEKVRQGRLAIKNNFCQIQEIGKKENSFSPKIIAYQEMLSKKEAVVEAINSFLKFYNKNKE